MKLFKGNLQQKGMTLMEILVVIGISGILFIIILSAVDYGVKGQKSVDSMQNISSYTLEIRQLLWRQEVCSPNIKSFFASSVTEGSNVGVSKILPVEKDAMGVYQVKAAAAPLIEAGENTPSAVKYGIKLKNMEINVAKKITDKFYVGDINLEFQTTQRTLGAEVFKRHFPIAIGVENGAFKYCGSLAGDEGAIMNDKICEISTKGDAYWDGTECKSKFIEQRFDGNELDAKCPGHPWIRAGCDNKMDPNNPTTPIATKRNRALPFSFNTHRPSPSDPDACECDMAVTSKGICVAICKKQVHFP